MEERVEFGECLMRHGCCGCGDRCPCFPHIRKFILTQVLIWVLMMTMIINVMMLMVMFVFVFLYLCLLLL